MTGTFAGVVPVRVVDGRPIGRGSGVGPVSSRLQVLYVELMDQYAAQGRRELSGLAWEG